MNQEVISVVLTGDNKSASLVFNIDEDKLSVDLCDDTVSQTQLKTVFSRLLGLVAQKDIRLQYSDDGTCSVGLYKEVSKEYINSLNIELSRVIELVKNTISEIPKEQ